MLAVAAIVAVAVVVVADCGLVPGHTYCLSYCRGANNRGYRNRSTWLGKKTKCGTMGKQRKTMTPVPGSLSLSLSLSLDRRKDRGAMPLVKKSRTRAQRQREGGHSLCFSSARSSLNEWTWAWEAPPMFRTPLGGHRSRLLRPKARAAQAIRRGGLRRWG